jgi:DNA-binding MarR family transcriptional regulator
VKAPDTSTEGAAALPTPETAPAFRSVGFALSTAGYAVSHRFRSILAPLGLEPREFALLRAIGATEGQSQQEASERLQIPASRMVAFVDGMEARGLAERRANPEDRRTRALYLTDAGRELLEQAFALAAAYEQELCAGLGDEEREQLLDLVWRVGGQLGLAEGVHAAHKAMTDHADEQPCS